MFQSGRGHCCSGHRVGSQHTSTPGPVERDCRNASESDPGGPTQSAMIAISVKFVCSECSPLVTKAMEAQLGKSAPALNAAGIGVEHRLSNCIRDPRVRAAVGSVKLTRFIVDMGLSAAAGGMGYKAAGAAAAGRGCVQRVVDSEGASDTFAARVPEALIDQ